MVVQMGVEPDRELGGVVDAALQSARDIAETEVGLQPFLGVDREETLLEIGDRGASLEPVIGREHRAAGDAGKKVEAVEQRYLAGAGRNPRFFETGQHAVGESRRAHAAAGERQRHDHVVVIGLDVRGELGFDLPGICGQRLIDRIVVDGLGTAGQEGGTGNDAPRADRTLNPTPKHLQKLIGGPRRPVKQARADGESKTSLRLIKKELARHAGIAAANLAESQLWVQVPR